MAVKPNRKRYILFEIISDKKNEFEITKKAIFDSANNLLGSLDISKAHLKMLPDFYSKNLGVISVNHNYVPKIKLAIALIEKISPVSTFFVHGNECNQAISEIQLFLESKLHKECDLKLATNGTLYKFNNLLER